MTPTRTVPVTTLLAGLALAALAPTASAQVTFTQRTLVNDDFSFDKPQALRIADLDGDGDLDVFSGESDSFFGRSRWFENTGVIGAPFTIRPYLTSAIVDLALADLDDDGDTDLVFGGAGDNELSVLVVTGNDGAPTPNFFADPRQFLEQAGDDGLPDQVDAILIADLNNDGAPDLVAASSDLDFFNWYRNDTQPPNSGDFAERFIDFGIDTGEIVGAFRRGSIAAADLTGDGAVDLLLGLNGELRLYASDGATDPSFTHTQTWSLPGTVQVEVADMNADTYPDIVFATSTFSSGVLGVLYNNGASVPAFTRVDIATDGGFSGIQIGDIDLNGAPDILTVRARSNNGAGNGLRWYENDGNASPAFTQRDILVQNTTSIQAVATLGDLDQDGDLDVLHYVNGRSEITIFDNDLDPDLPFFTQQPASSSVPFGTPLAMNVAAENATGFQWFFDPAGPAPSAPVPGETDPSIVVTATQSGVYTCLATNTAGSTTSAPAILAVGPPDPNANECAADFDNDGDVDLGDFGIFGTEFGRTDCDG